MEQKRDETRGRMEWTTVLWFDEHIKVFRQVLAALSPKDLARFDQMTYRKKCEVVWSKVQAGEMK